MPVTSESWIIKKAALQRHKDKGLAGCYKGFPGDSSGKEFACNAGDLALMPWLGRSAGEGHGNPPQYSCLENPMDRGASGLHQWGPKKLYTTEQLTHTHWWCCKYHLSRHPHFIITGCRKGENTIKAVIHLQKPKFKSCLKKHSFPALDFCKH